MTDRREEQPNIAEDDAEPGLEAAVKGIAKGVAGRLKEVVGEFIDDPHLEEQGIVQQLDGKLQRAGVEPGSSEASPGSETGR